jgi:hypothetical protein
MGVNVSPDEPSNAELARMLDALSETMREDRRQEEAFHTRLEGRLDQLSLTIGSVQRDSAVDKATMTADLKATDTKISNHETWHQRQDKEAADRGVSSNRSAMLVVGILTCAATLLGSLVGHF